MDEYIKTSGIRCIDDEVDDRSKVAVLINAACVCLLVHTDGEQTDGIGSFTRQRPCEAVRFVLILFNNSEYLCSGSFRNVGIVVDDTGYCTA
ncbi:hypothetical protein D3C78_989500 [compost metagenome]